MITDDQVERAIKYLAETDEQHAMAKANRVRLEQLRKTSKAIGFLDTDGTVAEREAEAYSSAAYQKVISDYSASVYDEQLLVNKRLRAQLTIDVWRSENANRRQGS